MNVGSERVIPSYQPEWCMALHGNRDEHQCCLKSGHQEIMAELQHECYCGVRW